MLSKGLTLPISFNTSSMDNIEVFFSEAFRILMGKLCIHTPGIIEAYDRKTHIARIRPMVKIRYSNDTIEEAQPLTVEIRRMAAGGFVIDFPIKEGDTGWFMSSDRDVSAIKMSGKTGLPSSAERHSFKRGFWIPDMWGELELGENTENCLTIQSLDGSQKISLGNGKIFVTASTVEVTTDEAIVTATNSASVTSSKIEVEADEISMTGKTKITGDTTIKGNLTMEDGTVTLSNGVEVDTHIHYVGEVPTTTPEQAPSIPLARGSEAP